MAGQLRGRGAGGAGGRRKEPRGRAPPRGPGGAWVPRRPEAEWVKPSRGRGKEREEGSERGRGSRYLSGGCGREGWAAAAASSRQSGAQAPAPLMAGGDARGSPHAGAHPGAPRAPHRPGLPARRAPHPGEPSPALSHAPPRGSPGSRACAAGGAGALF